MGLVSYKFIRVIGYIKVISLHHAIISTRAADIPTDKTHTSEFEFIIVPMCVYCMCVQFSTEGAQTSLMDKEGCTITSTPLNGNTVVCMLVII